MNLNYPRIQSEIILNLLNSSSHRVIFVRGPRQVGKTFLMRKHVLPTLNQDKCHYIAVDSAEQMILSGDTSVLSEIGVEKDVRWLVDLWNRARQIARASGEQYVLVIDEIQKIKGWSETVKGLSDQDRNDELNLHVVLLGSSPLLIGKGVSESLLGRFDPVNVTHWSFAEMMEAFDFDLNDYIYFGGYPGSAKYVGNEDSWRAYVRNALVQPNIEIDILKMIRIDKPALFKQLFELSCSYSGEILSYNKMLGQLQDAGNTTTLAHYLDLLERAGLVIGIQQYSEKPIKTKQSSPKLNVLNTALMSIASSYTKEQAIADRSYWGRMVESAVGAHIYNTMDANTKLYYWREGNYEVDFVIERGGKLFAIEVKSGAKKQKLPGLDVFAEKFKNRSTQKILVGLDGISIAEFLSYPMEHWLE